MRVLVGCESSGVVRDAFIAAGHDAISCDLLPTEAPGPHHQGDVRDILAAGFDLAVFHPPCTYLSSSGLHWNHRTPGRAAKTEEGLALVRDFMAAPIARIAIENPIGCIGTRIRPADQTVQPYEFGDDASKATCLWLKGLSPLVSTTRFPGRIATDPRNGKTVERWSNQTDSGQNRIGPSADRWKLRSVTYPGIAAAMADQWGNPDAALPLLQRMTA